MITFLVSYPRDALPTDEALGLRIAELQKHYPLLSSTIIDSKTRKPYFQAREQVWTTSDIVHHEPLASGEDEEGVLKREIKRMSKEDVARPLWQVTIYQRETAHLALSAAHELFDGVGVRNLLNCLLAPSIAHLPKEVFDTPHFEDLVDVRPGYLQMVASLFTGLVLPRLATFLQNYLKPQTWPLQLELPTSTCEEDLSVLSLSIDVIDQLKSVGKAHNVPTLHPILHTAFSIAIYSVFSDVLNPFIINTSIPRSERDPAFAYITGNYTSSISHLFALQPPESFWSLAESLGKAIKSPTILSQARGRMGMFAYLPDPAIPEYGPTGWEDFIRNHDDGSRPPRQGVTISNLGHCALPPGATDLIWSGSAGPMSAPFNVLLLGHRGGIRWTTTWFEGSIVTRREVKEVEAAFERIVERLLASQDDVRVGDLA